METKKKKRTEIESTLKWAIMFNGSPVDNFSSLNLSGFAKFRRTATGRSWKGATLECLSMN